jgi:hypothetical protein
MRGADPFTECLFTIKKRLAEAHFSVSSPLSDPWPS